MLGIKLCRLSQFSSISNVVIFHLECERLIQDKVLAFCVVVYQFCVQLVLYNFTVHIFYLWKGTVVTVFQKHIYFVNIHTCWCCVLIVTSDLSRFPW